jgi:hypothetical protein
MRELGEEFDDLLFIFMVQTLLHLFLALAIQNTYLRKLAVQIHADTIVHKAASSRETVVSALRHYAHSTAELAAFHLITSETALTGLNGRRRTLGCFWMPA